VEGGKKTGKEKGRRRRGRGEGEKKGGEGRGEDRRCKMEYQLVTLWLFLML
jgi:hypothetical protein